MVNGGAAAAASRPVWGLAVGGNRDGVQSFTVDNRHHHQVIGAFGDKRFWERERPRALSFELKVSFAEFNSYEHNR